MATKSNHPSFSFAKARSHTFVDPLQTSLTKVHMVLQQQWIN